MMNEPENSTRCGRCLRLLPTEFTREIINLFSLALPVFLSYFFDYLIIFVSSVFCGHLGKVELDGVTLATAAITVFGVGIGYGLAAACDTLISQTYGAGNLLQVGVLTQRATLILLLACLPCCAILVNTESILLLVHQRPEVARVSQVYVDIFLPSLPAIFIYIIEAKFLQNQGIIWPLVITGVVANILNALANYIFLFVLKMGVEGSAAANTISQYSLAITLFLYIRFKGLHKQTWAGWSMDCLQEWGSFVSLSIPSMLMLSAELWTFEMGGLLAGLISEVELGAQSVIYGLANIAYMFPIGFSVAGNVRVGNAVGAGDVVQAKLSAKLAIILDWKKASNEAQIRAGVEVGRTQEDSSQENGFESCDGNSTSDLEELVQQQDEVVVATVKVQLPLSTLVLRRGLALAAMFGILAVGLFIKYFLKR
ncbi:hypothetical protein DNTS_004783 [Danionella cerebrum]|uniref:Multidrug and toxin extrusion protein n=1 Tax=Danionella cerebrum TaxID=2873325 RepID=A0A553RFI3_9TELE|nr:hypothetical protein DNTS_004783 [Danionella translucida]